jgi:hypothetical protein
LCQARRLQRQGLLACYMESLVVVIIRHSASVFPKLPHHLVNRW